MIVTLPVTASDPNNRSLASPRPSAFPRPSSQQVVPSRAGGVWDSGDIIVILCGGYRRSVGSRLLPAILGRGGIGLRIGLLGVLAELLDVGDGFAGLLLDGSRRR